MDGGHCANYGLTTIIKGCRYKLPMPYNRSCGFTLIELLIVVAIIAILAAIAVPNFLEAQVRAKVSRVQADMRSMATALEAYAVDHNKYPTRRSLWENHDPNEDRFLLPNFLDKVHSKSVPGALIGLRQITTPIAYITSLPSDVFYNAAAALKGSDPFASDCIDYLDPIQTDAYISVINLPLSSKGKGRGWTLLSVGPDGAIGSGVTNPGAYPPTPTRLRNTYPFIYDPSNGTVSSGNIFRFQGNLSQRDIFFRQIPSGG